MGPTEKRFTGTECCGHCSNSAPMEIVAEYSTVKSYDDYPRSNIAWEAGTVYQLLACPACENISLRSYYWHDEPVGECKTLRNLSMKMRHPVFKIRVHLTHLSGS